MADRLYPISLAELERWRAQHRVSADEARKRFIQFVVLEAIAADPALGPSVVFKGGNALRFVYGSTRSTADLDFTADDGFPDDDQLIRSRLDAAFRRVGPRYGVKLRCQRVRRNPKSKERTTPTYDIAAGYLLPGDRGYADFEASRRDVPSVIPIEITLNDVFCETTSHRLHPASGDTLRVCALEDILAEKLRALLQQRIRGRSRPQDVLDIARMVRTFGPDLDLGKVSQYLVIKCETRLISPRKRDYDDDIKARASVDYAQLLAVGGPSPIPLDEAWIEVLQIVSRLDIPD